MILKYIKKMTLLHWLLLLAAVYIVCSVGKFVVGVMLIVAVIVCLVQWRSAVYRIVGVLFTNKDKKEK